MVALQNVGCFLKLILSLNSWLDVTGSWPSFTFASRGVGCKPYLLLELIFTITFSFKSRLSLIVQVNVVLNRTVVVDSD